MRMKKKAIILFTILLAIALIATPTVAGISSPLKFKSIKVSSQRTLLSGLNVNNPSTLQPFATVINDMDFSPAPQPEHNLPAYSGLNYLNLWNTWMSSGSSSGCSTCSH